MERSRKSWLRFTTQWDFRDGLRQIPPQFHTRLLLPWSLFISHMQVILQKRSTWRTVDLKAVFVFNAYVLWSKRGESAQWERSGFSVLASLLLIVCQKQKKVHRFLNALLTNAIETWLQTALRSLMLALRWLQCGRPLCSAKAMGKYTGASLA